MTITTLIGLGGLFVALRYLPGPDFFRETLAGFIPLVLNVLVWRWLARKDAHPASGG